MMDAREKRPCEVIRRALDERALLEQLAEEAAELAQAALKLVRVRGNGNPTPVTAFDAEAALIEELSDATLVAAMLGITPDSVEMDKKAARWADRLEKAGINNVGGVCGTCCWYDTFLGVCRNRESDDRVVFPASDHWCCKWEGGHE